MENLNAEQIKKVLEHCTNWTFETGCKGCPYEDNCIDEDVTRDALALINSQEQKIFELENRLKECENGYKGTNFLDRCKLHDAEEKVKKLTEENERLRAIPEQMKERLQAYFGTYVLGYKIPLSEALKAVNQIAKEMLEDKLCT